MQAHQNTSRLATSAHESMPVHCTRMGASAPAIDAHLTSEHLCGYNWNTCSGSFAERRSVGLGMAMAVRWTAAGRGRYQNQNGGGIMDKDQEMVERMDADLDPRWWVFAAATGALLVVGALAGIGSLTHTTGRSDARRPVAAAGDLAASGAEAAGGWASSRLESAGQIRIPWLPPTIQPWADELEGAAARYRVDPELLAIVVLVESGGNPVARSPSGAMGLMQVMPFHFRPGQDAFDVRTNIDVGARYLAQQLKTFGHRDDPDWQRSVELAAAAYNGGPGSVRRYLQGGVLPRESAAYRRWVGGMWRERHQPHSLTYQAWLLAGGRHLIAAAQRSLALNGS